MGHFVFRLEPDRDLGIFAFPAATTHTAEEWYLPQWPTSVFSLVGKADGKNWIGTDKMNLLLLTHNYPYPPDAGGRIVTFNTIEFLVRRGHRLHIVTFARREARTGLDDFAQVHIVEKDPEYSPADILKNLISPLPVNSSKYIDKRVFEVISTIFRREKIHAVLVEHLHMAAYGKFIAERYPGTPVVLRQHNVESTIMNRFYKRQTNLFVKTYAWLQYMKLFRYESEIVSAFDKCIMLTRNDFQRMTRMNKAVRGCVVNAGVDVEKYAPADDAHKDGNTLIFLGDMKWRPNEDALVWFLNNIFKSIEKEIPSVRLLVVGKDPSEKIRRFANSKNIAVTGWVPDERPYLAKAAVVIVPLRIGGGMRIKILNSMAMGKCVVSTSIGAEGIDAVDGKHIVLADSPGSFAGEICRILKNPAFAQKIGSAARKLTLGKYTWPIVLGRLEGELKAAAAKRRTQ